MVVSYVHMDYIIRDIIPRVRARARRRRGAREHVRGCMMVSFLFQKRYHHIWAFSIDFVWGSVFEFVGQMKAFLWFSKDFRIWGSVIDSFALFCMSKYYPLLINLCKLSLHNLLISGQHLDSELAFCWRGPFRGLAHSP